MKTLCIVPCGSKKTWDRNPTAGPCNAKDVYIGPFANKCKEYAVTFHPTSWCILSAKYGFLLPDDTVLGPYDVSFYDKKTKPITVSELKDQAIEKGLYNFDKIVVLGGKEYTKIAKATFPDNAVFTPLSDCKGIGYMMGKLNTAIKGNEPFVDGLYGTFRKIRQPI